MAAADVSSFDFSSLQQGHHSCHIDPGYSYTLPPSNPLMALEPRTSHYPLFISPHEQHSERTSDHRLPESNSTRCIIDKIKTIKLDTPALRRAQMSFQHPPRSSSLARRASRVESLICTDHGRPSHGEPSAFALTSARLSDYQAGPEERTARSTSHTRNQSLQQRRAQGALTITSPTARQARGRPAGPMIWLPDEQVWLLADSEAISGTAASTGVSFPNSAPLREAARATSPLRGRRREHEHQGESEINRLHRSDSSPIRTQFLRLMIRGQDDSSFSAQDWTQSDAVTGPSAAQEDAIWYAEHQARARSQRDQDRFSPLLQQALVGVDLPVDATHSSEYLAVPGEHDVWGPHTMRRSSTTGDVDNIANILAVMENGPGQRRTVAQRRSGNLRSRVSTVAFDEYDAHAASLHIRDLKEVAHQRRHSADEDTPRTTGDNYGHEWLASLVSQGIVPEGVFTPRASIVDEPIDDTDTPCGSSRMRGGFRVIDGTSPATSGISPVASGLSRNATTANESRWSQGRYMSVSTSGGDEARRSVELRNGGDVSPVSSRGRDSLYD